MLYFETQSFYGALAVCTRSDFSTTNSVFSDIDILLLCVGSYGLVYGLYHVVQFVWQFCKDFVLVLTTSGDTLSTFPRTVWKEGGTACTSVGQVWILRALVWKPFRLNYICVGAELSSAFVILVFCLEKKNAGAGDHENGCFELAAINQGRTIRIWLLSFVCIPNIWFSGVQIMGALRVCISR